MTQAWRLITCHRSSVFACRFAHADFGRRAAGSRREPAPAKSLTGWLAGSRRFPCSRSPVEPSLTRRLLTNPSRSLRLPAINCGCGSQVLSQARSRAPVSHCATLAPWLYQWRRRPGRFSTALARAVSPRCTHAPRGLPSPRSRSQTWRARLSWSASTLRWLHSLPPGPRRPAAPSWNSTCRVAWTCIPISQVLPPPTTSSTMPLLPT